MTTAYDVQVVGTAGTVVLTLPGGAASSLGFFPGIPSELPDHRVLLLDRPGTGTAVDKGKATLKSGADAAAAAIRAADAGPAVVLAQSLGGAVAVQLAVDYPELVAGLVLIDPTPFNDPRSCRLAGPVISVVSSPTKLPLIGARLDTLIWKTMAARTPTSGPEGAAALHVMISSATLQATARAVDTLVGDGAALTSQLRRLDVPVVLMTAQRKPGHRVRKAHDEIAAALGGRVEAWPDAIHAEHLRSPERVVALVRTVLAEGAS